ncbi:hypothetical protein HMPREF3050_02860 [Neisseria sp. HMSC065D04]|uniref:restriction endonuclease subunit S n=1 Tax=Neisseria sp. HMSC065D04 TaxID=1739542 RepID=UPI0008A2AD54|nr:restriction endonuclease subunit S [Neisseria sp. HMSC065D04]OFO36087.1 hypothetical protein HMPREF3050_02860 [Neisseria sp. HMSC065D04]
MNKQQEPRLRFKGFAGAWEIEKIGNLMNVTSVKRIHQSDWTSEGIRFLRARDIVAFSKGEKIEEPLFISEKKYKEYSELSGKVKIGDLLVTGVGTIGVPYLIENEEPIYFKDGNVIWFQNKNTVNGLFFYYSFLDDFIQGFIIETAGIGTVGTYTIDTGKKTPIFLPPTKPEQTAIGNFFRRLDSQIAESRAVLEKSRQLKKAMLVKMFPANGEKIPKIRFKGFEGEWECRKLGEVASSYSGGTPSVGNSKFYGGNIPFIRSGEIHSSKTELFLTQEGLENSSAKLVKQGDILYALYGATSGEVERSKINGAINQAILAIIPNENYDAEFISQWLKNNKENIVNLYLQGGQGNLSGEIVKKIEISFPTKKEQNAIGLFFRQLDETIALQSAEIEKLNRLKKGLLAAMLM